MGRGAGEELVVGGTAAAPKKLTLSPTADRNNAWCPKDARPLESEEEWRELQAAKTVAAERAVNSYTQIKNAPGNPRVYVELTQGGELVSVLYIDRYTEPDPNGLLRRKPKKQRIDLHTYELYRGRDLTEALRQASDVIGEIPEQEGSISYGNTLPFYRQDDVAAEIAEELKRRRELAEAGLSVAGQPYQAPDEAAPLSV